MNDRKPFITGSHAYGTPNAKSDLDMVVLIDREQWERIVPIALEEDEEQYGENNIPHLRIGNLDLILCVDPGLFDVWKNATDFLKTKAPVEREKAIEYMGKKRERYKAEQAKKRNDYDPAKARLEAKRKADEAYKKHWEEAKKAAAENTKNWPEGSDDDTFDDEEIPF